MQKIRPTGIRHVSSAVNAILVIAPLMVSSSLSLKCRPNLWTDGKRD
jgi:hypothetical protein